MGEDTRVLLADGTHRAIADLRVGDDIYGTSRVGRTRRFTRTSVLARRSGRRPAHRVTLADGTEIVTSSDQRFLTWRGWKHITGAERGRDRRPHLTIGAKLLGVGRLAELPSHDADYRAADLRVVSIKPLGKAMQMSLISTATGDVIANGVVSQTVGPPIEAKIEPDQLVAAGLSAQARAASSG
jgi:hypothetical protein